MIDHQEPHPRPAQGARHETPQNIGDLLREFLRQHEVDATGIPAFTVQHPQFRTCDQHGRYPISMVDETGAVRYSGGVCPVCSAERVSRHLLESAAISPRHHHCDFASFVAQTPAQKAVLDICADFADHFTEHAAKGNCLIFSGSHGTGKNHLAVAIARVVLGMGRSVLQVTAHDLILRLRQTWKKNDDGPAESAILRQFGAADLLIIDEIGKQFGGPAEEVHLFGVINRRYLDLKPTIVISNESPQGIEKYLGTAAFDRLCERGLLLQFDWPSLRRGQSA